MDVGWLGLFLRLFSIALGVSVWSIRARIKEIKEDETYAEFC
jgi:hypothetical protein